MSEATQPTTPAHPRFETTRARRLDDRWGGLALVGLGLGLAAACSAGCAVQPDHREASAPPDVVDEVELERYVGRWYELARYPNQFEDKRAYTCVGVTADYAVRDDGKISVKNTCHKDALDGETDVAKGVARSVSESDAKLEVSFAPEWLGVGWGDYWILDLTDDYSAALVGDPEGKYLWVLSRKPRLDDATWERLLATAEAQGYATAPLARVPQVER